jgi:hypothetical protein
VAKCARREVRFSGAPVDNGDTAVERSRARAIVRTPAKKYAAFVGDNSAKSREQFEGKAKPTGS